MAPNRVAGSCIWGEGGFNFDMILALAATAEAMQITEDTQRRAGASRRRSASSLPLRPARVHGVGEAIGAGLRVAQRPPSRQAHPCHRGAEEEERGRLRNHRWGSRLATCENLDVQGSPSRAQSKQQGSRTGVLNAALGPDERLEITPPQRLMLPLESRWSGPKSTLKPACAVASPGFARRELGRKRRQEMRDGHWEEHCRSVLVK